MLKKVTTGLIAGALSTALIPISAFAAVNTPSTEYEGGDGSNITKLTIISEDPDENLADDQADKSNYKVKIPVAINFVAEKDGTLVGPTDAKLINYSTYKVNVTEIAVAATSTSNLVKETNITKADDISIKMKPGTGTLVELASFTGDTPDKPKAGEWNIDACAKENNDGVSLQLNNLSGKIGGFNKIDPLVKTNIGNISWTIKAGTATATPTV